MTPGEALLAEGKCIHCHEPREHREWLICLACNAIINPARCLPGMSPNMAR